MTFRMTFLLIALLAGFLPLPGVRPGCARRALVRRDRQNGPRGNPRVPRGRADHAGPALRRTARFRCRSIGAVRIEGLTTDQAAAAITRKLADGYLVKPEVSVSIEARIRRTVTILGQAQRPGVFEIPAHRQLTLVEAIGMAGGVTRIANAKKISLKRLSGGGSVEIVNLSDITKGKGADIPLRDGDVITIPESLF